MEEKNNFYCLGLLLDIEIDICNQKKNENEKEKKNEDGNFIKEKEKSFEIFDKLIEVDFIRRKYWKWRKQNFTNIFI